MRNNTGICVAGTFTILPYAWPSDKFIGPPGGFVATPPWQPENAQLAFMTFASSVNVGGPDGIVFITMPALRSQDKIKIAARNNRIGSKITIFLFMLFTRFEFLELVFGAGEENRNARDA